MKKSMVFEAVAALLLILLIFAMYAMIAGNAPIVKDQWNTTISPSSYLYAGDNGVLYAFNGNNISAIALDGSLKWSRGIPKNWTITNDVVDTRKILPEYLAHFEGVDYSGMTDSGYKTRSTSYFTGFRPVSEPAVVSDDGILYVYVRPDFSLPNSTYNGDMAYGLERALGPGWEKSPSYARLMAISPDGNILWTKPLDNGTNEDPDPGWLRIDDVILTVSGDRIYVYHPYNLTVLDRQGAFLFRIDNVSDPAAIDERGEIFAVRAGKRTDSIERQYLLDEWIDPDYKVPSNTIAAYDPNGKLLWQEDVSEPAKRQELGTNQKYEYRTLPLYRNGVLYVPLKRGMVALSNNGGELWSTNFSVDMNLLWQMPFDGQNNLYLTIGEAYLSLDHYVVYTITPDGKCSNYTTLNNVYNIQSAGDGIGYIGSVYGINNTAWANQYKYNYSYLEDIDPLTITAIDLKNGSAIWGSTVPIDHVNGVTLAPSNVRLMDMFMNADANVSDGTIDFNRKHPEFQNLSRDAIGPWKIVGRHTMNVLADRNTVYVSYYAYNYEYPESFEAPFYVPMNESVSNYYDECWEMPVLNRSRLAYVSGILALDKHGRLLWNRPTDTIVTTMTASNSIVYYRTKGGELSATQVNAAMGFVLASMFYLFLRFVCLGAVVRAKARLDKNEKRNRILDFIADNPGSSLHETVRSTGVSLGTARYHLFILGLNHKITASRMDGKYVRYFTNAGSFSKEEQLVLSLMRRSAMGKVLAVMLRKPGLSNVEISRELNVPESVVSRCVKELSEKNVIVRAVEASKGTYHVREACSKHVADAIKRLQGQ